MQPKQKQPVSRLSARALEAFYHRLPELLRTHDRQWVAIRGEELVGFASSQMELHKSSVRRGLKVDEFVILFAPPSWKWHRFHGRFGTPFDFAVPERLRVLSGRATETRRLLPSWQAGTCYEMPGKSGRRRFGRRT
jgi:hypothetical protein